MKLTSHESRQGLSAAVVIIFLTSPGSGFALDAVEATRLLSERTLGAPDLRALTGLPRDASTRIGCLTPDARQKFDEEVLGSAEGRRLVELLENRRRGEGVQELTTQEAIRAYGMINKKLGEQIETTSATFWSMDHHTAGLSASVSLIGYDFGTKKASLNEGVGASLPWRWFPWKKVANVESECRPSTFSVLRSDKPMSELWFGFAPTIYVSKPETSSDLIVQPALLLTFIDLFYIGPGFNLTGPNQGNVMLFFGIGTSVK